MRHKPRSSQSASKRLCWLWRHLHAFQILSTPIFVLNMLNYFKPGRLVLKLLCNLHADFFHPATTRTLTLFLAQPVFLPTSWQCVRQWLSSSTMLLADIFWLRPYIGLVVLILCHLLIAHLIKNFLRKQAQLP